MPRCFWMDRHLDRDRAQADKGGMGSRAALNQANAHRDSPLLLPLFVKPRSRSNLDGADKVFNLDQNKHVQGKGWLGNRSIRMRPSGSRDTVELEEVRLGIPRTADSTDTAAMAALSNCNGHER